MIKKKTKYVTCFMVKHWLREHEGIDPSSMRGDALLEVIFGDIYDQGRFKVVDAYWQPEQKWYHRLNHLWAYPLTFLLAPLMYIVHGEIGWSDKNRFSRFILKACGYYYGKTE